jgi:5-methylcytosine-specific restriction endonuclease McrA
VGEKAAHWQGGMDEMSCEICGKHFFYKENKARRRRFCSVKCQAFAKHLESTGENHWNYKHGKGSAASGIKHFTYEYRQWHKQLLTAEKSCRKCGSTNRLETDHIIPIFIDSSKAFDIDNGQVLCYDCHRLKTLDDIQDIAEHRRKLKKYGKQQWPEGLI